MWQQIEKNIIVFCQTSTYLIDILQGGQLKQSYTSKKVVYGRTEVRTAC